MPELKLEDEEILSESPVEVRVGKKVVLLRLLTAYEYFVKFSPKFLAFLVAFGREIGDMEFPSGKEWAQKGPLERFRKQLTALASSERLRRGWFRLLKDVGIVRGISRRYFERNITVDNWVRIFLHVYRFNVHGLKKKVESAILEVLNKGSQDSTTSSPDGAGLAPGEYKVLVPRFPSSRTSKPRTLKSSSSGDASPKPPTGKNETEIGKRPAKSSGRTRPPN